jgi:hypothetical protein
VCGPRHFWPALRHTLSSALLRTHELSQRAAPLAATFSPGMSGAFLFPEPYVPSKLDELMAPISAWFAKLAELILAAPAIIAKTIQVILDSGRYEPPGAGEETPDAPVIAPTDIQANTATVSISAEGDLTSLVPYIDGVAQTAIAANSTSHQFTGLSSATNYTLGMLAIRSGRESSLGTVAILTDDPPVVTPAAPVIAFVSKTSTTITVSWTEPANAPTSYVPVLEGVAQAEITGLSHTFTGLSASTEYDVNIRAKNSAGTSANSNTVTQTTEAAVSTTQGCPVAAYLQGSPTPTSSAEFAARAVNDWLIGNFNPNTASSVHEDIKDGIAAAGANARGISTELFLYLNISEREHTGTAWEDWYDDLNTNNGWLYSDYDNRPAGIQVITKQAIAWATPRRAGGKLIGSERQLDIYDAHPTLDHYTGGMFDNDRPVNRVSGDWNQDGVTTDNSNTTQASRNAYLASMENNAAYMKSLRPGYKIGSNAKNWALSYLTGEANDGAALAALNRDFIVIELPAGRRIAELGIFPYNSGSDGSTLSQFRTYPGNASVSSLSAGTIYRNTSGGWKVATNGQPFYEVLKFYHDRGIPAIQRYACVQMKGFSIAEETTEARRAYNRFLLGAVWTVFDMSAQILSLTMNTGEMVVHPWMEYDFGDAIDECGADTGPYSTSGTTEIYRRVFENGCLICRTPAERTETSPTATVSVPLPTPPPGKKFVEFTGGADAPANYSLAHLDARAYKTAPI